MNRQVPSCRLCGRKPAAGIRPLTALVSTPPAPEHDLLAAGGLPCLVERRRKAIPRPGLQGLLSGMPEIADELIAGFASAWNAHDMNALAMLFHADGTFVNVAGSYEKGREEIKFTAARNTRIGQLR